MCWLSKFFKSEPEKPKPQLKQIIAVLHLHGNLGEEIVNGFEQYQATVEFLHSV